MNLKDRKFIPYYIAAAAIISLALILVMVILSSTEKKPEPETTTAETTSGIMDNGIPYYPDIPASAYPQELFTELDGRITYTDENVKYFNGIDVSSFQGDIDWEAVADDGIDFAIIRVGFRGYGSAGNICEDDMARKNIEEAIDAGIKVGVYFFSQALNAQEALEEAEFVLDIVDEYDIKYPIVFDWENEQDLNMRTDGMTGAAMTECATSFCERIKQEGYIPAVYFNLSFGYLRYDLSKLKDYVFWYAQYEGESPLFYYNYNIWQYSASGKVDGINTDVDMNISFTDF